jgi:excisionase family DNA binding protein
MLGYSTEVKPTLSNDDEPYTVADLSEHLRLHRSTIYHLLRAGDLPGFRVGRSRRFHRAQVEQWERLLTGTQQLATRSRLG